MVQRNLINGMTSGTAVH